MWSWIFGIGAMASLFISYQQKNRKGILTFKLCADLFWIAHYACLGAMGGLIANFVGVFREIIFINRGKHKFANKLFWPVIFILINIVLNAISFEGWYDIFPMIASSFATVAFWVNHPKMTKCISAPACATFLVYDIFVGSFIGAVNESISIISIALFFIRTKIKNTQSHQNNRM